MVAFAKAPERPQIMRAYMYKKVGDEILQEVFTVEDAEEKFALEGWKMMPIEWHPDDKFRDNEQAQEAVANYCRDWNMQLNLHLLTEKHQVVGLAKRCLKLDLNPKMSKGAMTRKFEKVARKMGVWMGGE